MLCVASCKKAEEKKAEIATDAIASSKVEEAGSNKTREVLKFRDAVKFHPEITIRLTFDSEKNKTLMREGLGLKISDSQMESVINSVLAMIPEIQSENSQNVQRSLDDEEPGICNEVNYGIGNCSGYDASVVLQAPPGTVWDPADAYLTGHLKSIKHHSTNV